MEINLEQAEELVRTFGGGYDVTLNLIEGNDSFRFGPGLYAHDEYPEHGLTFLGEGGE